MVMNEITKTQKWVFSVEYPLEFFNALDGCIKLKECWDTAVRIGMKYQPDLHELAGDIRKYFKKKYPKLQDSTLAKWVSPLNQEWRENNKKKRRKELEGIAPLIQIPDGVKLIHGDFTKSDIPGNSIDLIITDPPYGNEAVKLYEDLGQFAEYVLKDGGSLVTYAGQYTLLDVMNVLNDAGLKYWWVLCSIEGSASTQILQRKVFSTWKPILWYVKGDKTNAIDFIRDSLKTDMSKDLHEWEQPIDFVEKIIESLTVRNQVVLDPFMGSGTFGVAAHRLERNFIGIEKNEEVFNRAKGRISSAEG